jgi:hypothetical protein
MVKFGPGFILAGPRFSDASVVEQKSLSEPLQEMTCQIFSD